MEKMTIYVYWEKNRENSDLDHGRCTMVYSILERYFVRDCTGELIGKRVEKKERERSRGFFFPNATK